MVKDAMESVYTDVTDTALQLWEISFSNSTEWSLHCLATLH